MGVDYDSTIDESNKIRSSTGVFSKLDVANWTYELCISKKYVKQIQMKLKVSALIRTTF